MSEPQPPQAQPQRQAPAVAPPPECAGQVRSGGAPSKQALKGMSYDDATEALSCPVPPPSANPGPAPSGTAATPGASHTSLTNRRFLGDSKLEAVMKSKATVSKGAKGPHVRRVQAALEDLGHKLPKYHADGQYGDETVTGAVNFQAAEALVTANAGVIDYPTMAALDVKTPQASADVYQWREREVDATKSGTTDKPTVHLTLTNPRFQGDPVLELVISGFGAIAGGEKRPHVWRIQQALTDLNFDLKGAKEGTYDAVTKKAVAAFQEAYNVKVKAPDGEATLGEDVKGVVDSNTLAALDAYAPQTLPTGTPPPDKDASKRPRYEELFADGKLEVTLALGFDEGIQAHVTKKATSIDYLQNELGMKLTDARVAKDAELQAVGLDPKTADREALYFTRTMYSKYAKKQVQVAVRLIAPNEEGTNGADVLARYKQSLEKDDVSIYTGHARAGTGPDFDPHDSTAGNYVMGKGYHADYNNEIKNAENQLEKTNFSDKYQLYQFWGCTTEHYDKHLNKALGKQGKNVQSSKDIVVTNQPVLSVRGLFGTLAFLRGLLAEASAETLQDMLNTADRRKTSKLEGFNG